MQTLGLAGSFPGYEGRIAALNEIVETWSTTELEPAYIVDLGDRVLPLGFMRTQATASGVEQELAQVITVRDGLITRDEVFFSWEEGLRAAGLDPDALPRPSHERRVSENSR